MPRGEWNSYEDVTFIYKKLFSLVFLLGVRLVKPRNRKYLFVGLLGFHEYRAHHIIIYSNSAN